MVYAFHNHASAFFTYHVVPTLWLPFHTVLILHKIYTSWEFLYSLLYCAYVLPIVEFFFFYFYNDFGSHIAISCASFSTFVLLAPCRNFFSAVFTFHAGRTLWNLFLTVPLMHVASTLQNPSSATVTQLVLCA